MNDGIQTRVIFSPYLTQMKTLEISSPNMDALPKLITLYFKQCHDGGDSSGIDHRVMILKNIQLGV